MPKHVALIAGAAANLARTLAATLIDSYTIVCGYLQAGGTHVPILEADSTDEISIGEAINQIRGEYGTRIASVLHLAAFLGFSGEGKPRYRSVNVDGSRHLVRALCDMEG